MSGIHRLIEGWQPIESAWPGVVPAGTISPAVSHITDITATVFDVAGETYPSDFDHRVVTPMAGRSLLPVLEGGARAGHESLCWATSGSKAVRMGDWKLVALPGKPWELYELKTDRTELHDLASRHPDRVAMMAKVFEAWRKH